MRALLFLSIATLPLAACNVERTDKEEKKVSFDAAYNGAVAFQVPGLKGNIKLPVSMMKSSDMDIDGVKLFPESKVQSVRAEDENVTIGFTAPAGLAEVKDYYGRHFAEKGVTATSQGDGFVGKTKDGDDFTLTFAETNGGTAGTMHIHDNNK